MPLPDGTKNPLVMFLLATLSLCLACYVGGRGSFGYYAISVLSACIITWRWSDHDAMPRWLYWALLIPLIFVLSVFGYFLVAGRVTD